MTAAEHLGDVGQVAAGGVHGGEFDVGGVAAGVLHRGHRHLQDLVPVLAHLVLQVDVGSGDKGVDPRIGGLFDRLPTGVDILLEGPGQPGDLRTANFPGYGLHRGKVTGRGKGKPGLDDVHVEQFQVPGDLQFFVDVEIGPGGLFPIPQGGIENHDFIGHTALLSPKGHQEATVLYHRLLQKEAVKTISLVKLGMEKR